MMRHMLAFIFLCLSYSIEGRAQEIHCDTILEKRIYEYIGLFKDYLQFMSNEQKSLETRCYYEKKAEKNVNSITKSKSQIIKENLCTLLLIDKKVSSVR